jgi:hypothetical protein
MLISVFSVTFRNIEACQYLKYSRLLNPKQMKAYGAHKNHKGDHLREIGRGEAIRGGNRSRSNERGEGETEGEGHGEGMDSFEFRAGAAVEFAVKMRALNFIANCAGADFPELKQA